MIKVFWISEFFYGAPVLCKSVTEVASPQTSFGVRLSRIHVCGEAITEVAELMYCMLHLLHWIYPVGTFGLITVSFFNF